MVLASAPPPTTTSWWTAPGMGRSGGGFMAAAPHEFVVAGAAPSFDGERLLADTQKICETEIAFWHADGNQPPMDRYVFMLNVVDDNYGGLEHRNSTALICGPPRPAAQGETKAAGEGYNTLLGLISHEYFHTWNVKRLRPSEFAATTTSRRTTPSCCGSSRASPATTTICFLRAPDCWTAASTSSSSRAPSTRCAADAGPPGAVRGRGQLLTPGSEYYRQDEEHRQSHGQLLRQGSLVAPVPRSWPCAPRQRQPGRCACAACGASQ